MITTVQTLGLSASAPHNVIDSKMESKLGAADLECFHISESVQGIVSPPCGKTSNNRYVRKAFRS